MDIDFKDIHIGNCLKKQVKEQEISIDRICKYFRMHEEEIIRMYSQKSLDTAILLKWCKLAEYDFFRLYVTHLLLYDGISHTKRNKETKKVNGHIIFRKNIYTKEIKEFLVSLVSTNQKSVSEIMEEYNIPRTTIYKWLRKH